VSGQVGLLGITNNIESYLIHLMGKDVKIARSLVLGQYLRNKRSERGVTQAYVAAKLGYTAQFVTNWERGVSSPPANVLRKLVQILKIDPNELLDLLASESKSYWMLTLSPNKNKSRKYYERLKCLRQFQ